MCAASRRGTSILSLFDEWNVFGVEFDGDDGEPQLSGSFDGGAGPGEEVEDDTARRCDERHQPADESQGFDCHVFDTVDTGAFRFYGFGVVVEYGEEPRNVFAATACGESLGFDFGHGTEFVTSGVL